MEWIEPVDLPAGHELTVSKLFITSRKILSRPISFSEKDVHSIENIYNKIKNHKDKEYIDNILNLLTTNTSNERESFFYKWISFNQIYSYKSDDGDLERKSIEKFAIRFSKFPESSQHIQSSMDFFKKLYKKDHFNRKKTKNYSTKLKKGIKDDNHSEVWKYSMLCVYSIRNEFFHGGEENECFGKLSKFLDNLVLTALNNIFELKSN